MGLALSRKLGRDWGKPVEWKVRGGVTKEAVPRDGHSAEHALSDAGAAGAVGQKTRAGQDLEDREEVREARGGHCR